MTSRLLWLLLLTPVWLFGSEPRINPALLAEPWPAKWIRAEQTSDHEYGVYQFRKVFSLDRVPESLLVHVSADCRYKLYLNGVLVSLGPAAGDYYNWNFESVELSQNLRTGENVLAAIVWNEGEERPEYQISFRTGFILQSDRDEFSNLNTNTSWKARRSLAFEPISGIGYPTYYVSGPGEQRDFRHYEEDWTRPEFDASTWPKAEAVPVGWPLGGKPKGIRNAGAWMLKQRSIPMLELIDQEFASIREWKGLEVKPELPSLDQPLKIPANSSVWLLLDHGVLTNAYPDFRFSKGEDAIVTFTYAESLFENLQTQNKGNRNEVARKTMVGRRDRILLDGREVAKFEPLSWRTYRYVKVEIETGEEELEINSLSSTEVAYSFKLRSNFQSSDESLAEIMKVGWRTARLCAVETYMDCPYYEQLQYVGDTRIQALVSLYNTGDDRLLRNALNLMDQSRISEGLTLSRHPSKTPQIISTFSLWYIGMLHDYWWYGDDAEFVADKLIGLRGVLDFFARYEGDDGRLVRPPYWLFTDWVSGFEGWDFGEPPFGPNGDSSIIDLQYLWALQLAAELETELGYPFLGDNYRARASKLKTAIRAAYWNADKSIFANHTGPNVSESQHAYALAILSDTLLEEEQRLIVGKLESGKGMAPASIYFKYYLNQALAKAGLGDRYLLWLDDWRRNIELGLSTWAEISEIEYARSDCHAWGSSPNIEFHRIILGIDSSGPGFSKVKIEPALGSLTQASGSIPHPLGELSASYRKTGDKWVVELVLPDSLDGEFHWQGESYPLHEGVNRFEL